MQTKERKISPNTRKLGSTLVDNPRVEKDISQNIELFEAKKGNALWFIFLR